jgi:hypothetical protein
VTGSGLQVAVVDDTGRLNLINHDGHILWTRCVRDSPTACPAALHASAIIADIDGNGTQDVVVGGEQWVWAFSGNGTTLVGAPSVAGTNPLTAAPTVTNVNGHTTIIAAGEDTVNSPMTARLFLWQPAGMVLGRAVWPTFKRGNDRSADIASLASPGVTWAGGNQPDVFDASPTGPSVEERAYQGSSWSALWNLGGGTYDGVATATDTAGTTAVFIRGLNNGVYERVRQGGGWTGWTALGGATVQTPAAAALPGGGFAEAVIGTDEAVWVHTGGWTRLGGAAIGAPAIASLGGSDLLVAVTGTDRRVWTDRYVGGRWSGWLPLSGSSRFGPTLAGTPAGADLYVTGSDGALWATSTARSGSWVGWHSLGGHLMSPPSAYTDGNGHTGVVAYGIDARLWLHSASGSWSAVP